MFFSTYRRVLPPTPVRYIQRKGTNAQCAVQNTENEKQGPPNRPIATIASCCTSRLTRLLASPQRNTPCLHTPHIPNVSLLPSSKEKFFHRHMERTSRKKRRGRVEKGESVGPFSVL
mmetsp:Transcript_3382/g.7681  ORF Transcript_3382/g.7681 Transcript_3382/m.7681 type:complete len:117 (-) Transcript_3382:434-784(-)